MKKHEVYQQHAEIFLKSGQYFEYIQNRKVMMDMLSLTLKRNILTAEILLTLTTQNGRGINTILSAASLELLEENYSQEFVGLFHAGFSKILEEFISVLKEYETDSIELYKGYFLALEAFCKEDTGKIN